MAMPPGAQTTTRDSLAVGAGDSESESSVCYSRHLNSVLAQMVASDWLFYNREIPLSPTRATYDALTCFTYLLTLLTMIHYLIYA